MIESGESEDLEESSSNDPWRQTSLFDALGNLSASSFSRSLFLCAVNFVANCGDSKNWGFMDGFMLFHDMEHHRPGEPFFSLRVKSHYRRKRWIVVRNSFYGYIGIVVQSRGTLPYLLIILFLGVGSEEHATMDTHTVWCSNRCGKEYYCLLGLRMIVGKNN